MCYRPAVFSVCNCVSLDANYKISLTQTKYVCFGIGFKKMSKTSKYQFQFSMCLMLIYTSKFSPEKTKILHFSSSGSIFLSRVSETSFRCLRPPRTEFKLPLARGQQPPQEEPVIVAVEQVAQCYGKRWVKHLQYCITM